MKLPWFLHLSSSSKNRHSRSACLIILGNASQARHFSGWVARTGRRRLGPGRWSARGGDRGDDSCLPCDGHAETCGRGTAPWRSRRDRPGNVRRRCHLVRGDAARRDQAPGLRIVRTPCSRSRGCGRASDAARRECARDTCGSHSCSRSRLCSSSGRGGCPARNTYSGTVPGDSTNQGTALAARAAAHRCAHSLDAAAGGTAARGIEGAPRKSQCRGVPAGCGSGRATTRCSAVAGSYGESTSRRCARAAAVSSSAARSPAGRRSDAFPGRSRAVIRHSSAARFSAGDRPARRCCAVIRRSSAACSPAGRRSDAFPGRGRAVIRRSSASRFSAGDHAAHRCCVISRSSAGRRADAFPSLGRAVIRRSSAACFSAGHRACRRCWAAIRRSSAACFSAGYRACRRCWAAIRRSSAACSPAGCRPGAFPDRSSLTPPDYSHRTK